MTNQTNQKPIDTPSHRGKFGWERIGTNETDLAIPVIIRTNGVRYCPTKIVEQEIIKKYATLPQNVFTCITLKSYFLTVTEARLLTEINVNHCNQYYGPEFFRTDDVIISAADIKNLARFLNVAMQIHSKSRRDKEVFHGVVNLVIDPEYQQATRIIPFLVKTHNNETLRYIPSKLVSTFVDTSRPRIRGFLNEWDIMYCKMLLFFANAPDEIELKKDDLLIPLVGSTYIKTGTPIIFYDCDH